jgi:hypothetical protein
VSLPIDESAYEAALKEKIAGSKFKKEIRDAVVNMSDSF